MSLLSVDISKVKRPSLTEVKLPAPEVRVEPTTILVERPPTEEEIAYSKLVAVNPLVEILVDEFRLVSPSTGKPFRKVELSPPPAPDPQEARTDPAPYPPVIYGRIRETKPEQIDAARLIALAHRVIPGQDSYTREEIVERIQEATGVSGERAEKGFNLILQAGAIEPTLRDRYYLAGSTPF